MDIELILESIFNEYKEKCIKEGKERLQTEKQLELVREQVETTLRDRLESYIGRPVNEATRDDLLEDINRSLNKFLDTDIKLVGISMDRDAVTVDMIYTPKYPIQNIKLEGSVTMSTTNPLYEIVSQTL